MVRFQGGDGGAFDELFRRNFGRVVNFSYQFVGSLPRAQEIAQEVFIQVARAAGRYTPRARFTTWLYRIATNACLNELRRPEHRVVVRGLGWEVRGGKGEEGEANVADEGAVAPDDCAAGSELADKIRASLERLPGNQRAALLLSRVEGMSYREVAQTIEVSEGAVKSLVFRATATMRHELAEFLDR